ncbi:MAG: Eco47II family restriction endonuclease [Candidatus Nomurabacteria bacterium]|jgi:type II restriction enzyme|nr:Eco47II family restriction endonuclease [Candidatus Nomurabacteria bacterium]
MYNLAFISQADFEGHVLKTIGEYNEALQGIDLAKFNNNIIDPIKLLFDKSVYGESFDGIIDFELQRQRDKTNSNSIGYFHQNIFQYIKGCTVPPHGFDVIYIDGNGKHVYVEMKNKHNTMNSASSQKTYMKMQSQILKTPNEQCFLVEVIAKKSQNIAWNCKVDETPMSDERIRRVSIDQFYKLVTGIDDAFYQICIQLPITITSLINANKFITAEKDTALEELKRTNPDMLTALYMLAFKSYEGF